MTSSATATRDALATLQREGRPSLVILEHALPTSYGVLDRADDPSIEGRQQTLARRLSGDGRELGPVADHWGAGTWCNSAGDALVDAAIGICHQHAPTLVQGGVHEIEQVAACIRPTTQPDTVPLHGGIWSRINSHPARAPVIRMGYVQMPFARKRG